MRALSRSRSQDLLWRTLFSSTSCLSLLDDVSLLCSLALLAASVSNGLPLPVELFCTWSGFVFEPELNTNVFYLGQCLRGRSRHLVLTLKSTNKSLPPLQICLGTLVLRHDCLTDICTLSINGKHCLNILSSVLAGGDNWVALIDTQNDSIQSLNFGNNWFNSIFDSILISQNSIQRIIQFKKNCGDSIQ